MAHTRVDEKQIPFKPEMDKNAPGAKAVMNVTINTDETISDALVQVAFSGPVIGRLFKVQMAT